MKRVFYLVIPVVVLAVGLSYLSQLPSPVEPVNFVVVNMTTRNWRFDPVILEGDATTTVSSQNKVFADSTIRVRRGTTLTIHISNLEPNQPHGISLVEFGISEIVPPQGTITIQFLANQEGIYEFFCNVFCGSGHPRHRGTLIVG
jgi:heme/copper-type cytochrome/quinol oxidase subunit 2